MEQKWLERQRVNLIDFGRLGYHEEMGGFGRLQADGTILEHRGLETWVNCRAIYCFALDVLAGNSNSMEWVEKGADCLMNRLYDTEHGGWFTGISETGDPNYDGRKDAYTHAFVLLAASSLLAVESVRAAEVFDLVEEAISSYFWSESERASLESWDRNWSASEPYRGANSNMHMTEAFLAAFDVTKDEKWLHRAEDIVDRIVGEYARLMGWRIPEHFDDSWNFELDYNRDEPNHAFRPYGSTPGHGFEWSRLVLQLSKAVFDFREKKPSWYQEAAANLFHQAARDGWMRDGEPGFCYTVDFDGDVVVSLHLAWVTCEALSAAIVLDREAPSDVFSEWIEKLWNYCSTFLVDEERGGWKTELDSHNRPSAVVWGDKPDFYHPFQCVLMPGTATGPSLLGGIHKPD